MVSRKLMGVWVVLDLLLLAAGALALALSIVWRAPNILMNMVLSPSDLTAGAVLGVTFLITFAFSIGAIVQRSHVTSGLEILNYMLLFDATGIIVIGSFVWFYTLRERANFYVLWKAAGPASRIFLQDEFRCCGYFNGSDTVEIGGLFCTSQTVVESLDPTILNDFCVNPITGFADMTLNNIFTTVYGFMAIIVCLLLATLCVIKERRNDERFKRIDEKRGGKGFV